MCGRYPSVEGLRRAGGHVLKLCHLGGLSRANGGDSTRYVGSLRSQYGKNREEKRFILCFPKHNHILTPLFQIVEENW